MRNIIDINSEWMLSTDKNNPDVTIHKRILPLLKEDTYCYYLELLSAVSSMDIFINGEKIASHTGSFSPFYLDITDRIVNGDNELDIHCNGDVPCQSASLVIVGKTHFQMGAAGLAIVPTSITAASASIRICAHGNHLPENALISYTVLTTSGMMLANKSVPAHTPEYVCHLTSPHLWNGSISPDLYVVIAGLIIDGQVEDQVILPFGLRTVNALSGNLISVNGTALPENGLLFTLEADPYAYDDMDESGTCVCVDFTDLCQNTTSEEDCQKQLISYVQENAYHPCILCWKLPEGYEEYASVLRETDPTRPVLF